MPYETEQFPGGFFVYLSAEKVLENDLHTDGDQNHTAQNGGFSGQESAEPSSEAQTAQTDKEGYDTDDQRLHQSEHKAVIGDGEAHRQSVDGGGHALDHQSVKAHSGRRFLVLAMVKAFPNHLAADDEQQDQGDPGDERLRGPEGGGDGVHADPAQQRHQRLKDPKGAGDLDHLAPRHMGRAQTVGHGDGKRIHGESHAKEYAVEKEHGGPAHTDASL